MSSTLVLTAPTTLTAPLPGTPKLKLRGDTFVLTSDSFNSANVAALSTRTTDAAMGGEALPYTFLTPAGFGINSGRLVRGTTEGNATAVVQLPATRSKDVTASCKILATPTASSPRLYLIVRRDNPTGSPQSQVRLGIGETSMSLNLYIDGASTTVSGSNIGVTAGDTVGVREYNGLVQMLINGTVVKEYRYSAGTFTGDYAGFAVGGSEPFAVDEFSVTETIH